MRLQDAGARETFSAGAAGWLDTFRREIREPGRISVENPAKKVLYRVPNSRAIARAPGEAGGNATTNVCRFARIFVQVCSTQLNQIHNASR